MANGTTLADLRAAALDYADLTNASFHDADSLDRYINAGLSDVQDILINAGLGDYLLNEYDITLVSGTEKYALPADFYRALSVYFIGTNGRRYPVRKWEMQEVAGSRTSPASGGSATLWYAPQLSRLVDPDDTVSLSVPVTWEDYPAIHAAIRLLIREESDTSQLMQERERLVAKFREMAEPRDMGRGGHVQDVYGRWNTGLVDYPEARDLRYRIAGNFIRFIENEYQGV